VDAATLDIAGVNGAVALSLVFPVIMDGFGDADCPHASVIGNIAINTAAAVKARMP
jgi:hypothetical protein